MFTTETVNKVVSVLGNGVFGEGMSRGLAVLAVFVVVGLVLVLGMVLKKEDKLG